MARSIHCIDALNDRRPFDLLLTNARIVNVFTGEVIEGAVGIVEDTIAYAGPLDFPHSARETIDCRGQYAVPGLIDSHMHIESSMLAPAHFLETILTCGTTTIAADPHEIGNVLGLEGIAALTQRAVGVSPVHVYMMAPSTIPSAPGLERCGFSMEAHEMAAALDLPGVYGLGEVMDFNAVADGDPRLLAVTQEAKDRGVVMDCHVPSLTGRRLQAFRCSGCDTDHTDMTLERAREKLAAGFRIQVQRTFFSQELMEFLNNFPLQDRIMLITDDVPFLELMEEGHLNANLRRAVALGLDPIRAIRFATINAAERLRLYDRGAVSPGFKADLCLMEDLTQFVPTLVLSDGKVAAREGKCLSPVLNESFPRRFYATCHLPPLEAQDFALPPVAGTEALCHVLGGDPATTRTTKEQVWLPIKKGALDTTGLVKLAVIYRHSREEVPVKEVSLGLLSGFPSFRGAIATTYSHDSHNLTVFGTDDGDMALACNRLLQTGGGLCAVQNGQVLAQLDLPVAGLLTEEDPKELVPHFEGFLRTVQELGLDHQRPMMFLTLMALAVSPWLKVTDLGLVDTYEKKFLPLILETR